MHWFGTDSVRAVNTALAATQSGPPTTSTSTPISAPRSSQNTFAQQQPPTGNTQPAIVAATQWPVPDQDPHSLEPQFQLG